MRIEIRYADGRVEAREDDGTIQTEPDRSMEDRAFYCDAQIIEHRELDADPDGYCDGCLRASRALDEIQAERERRTREDIQIFDPTELTFEERYAPYGPAWQEEQRDRGGF